jgi:hypothetical protein
MEQSNVVVGEFVNTAKEFVSKPYLFFREADAVAQIYRKVYRLVEQETHGSTGRIHLEYPTGFYKDEIKRKDKPGRFDLVILKPGAIKIAAEIDVASAGKKSRSQILYNLSRPNVEKRRLDGIFAKLKMEKKDKKLFSLIAEFKMCYEDLSRKRFFQIQEDIERLNNVMDFSENCIFLCLIRQLEEPKDKWYSALFDTISQKTKNGCRVVCGVYTGDKENLGKLLKIAQEKERPDFIIKEEKSGFIVTA